MVQAILILLLLPILNGCSNASLIQNSKLKINSVVSDTIFLDKNHKKTILLQTTSTSDFNIYNFYQNAKKSLEKRGYTVISKAKDEKEYDLTAQINIRTVSNILSKVPSIQMSHNEYSRFNNIKSNSNSIESILENWFPGIATGFLVSSDKITGAAIGGILWWSGNKLIKTLVQNKRYYMIVDVLIGEKTPSAITEIGELKVKKALDAYVKYQWKKNVSWKKYQTTIVTTASRINLHLDQNLAQCMSDFTAQSIAKILPVVSQ